mgnify:FL=1
MQQLFKNVIGNILTTVKDILIFLSDFLSKENGIRSLFILILTIPSICLLWLYYREKVENERLKAVNIVLQLEVNKNYKLYINAKDSLRATVFKEYIELSKAMNDLQESLNSSNDEKSKKILKYSNKVNEEINKVE